MGVESDALRLATPSSHGGSPPLTREGLKQRERERSSSSIAEEDEALLLFFSIPFLLSLRMQFGWQAPCHRR